MILVTDVGDYVVLHCPKLVNNSKFDIPKIAFPMLSSWVIPKSLLYKIFEIGLIDGDRFYKL